MSLVQSSHNPKAVFTCISRYDTFYRYLHTGCLRGVHSNLSIFFFVFLDRTYKTGILLNNCLSINCIMDIHLYNGYIGRICVKCNSLIDMNFHCIGTYLSREVPIL